MYIGCLKIRSNSVTKKKCGGYMDKVGNKLDIIQQMSITLRKTASKQQ